MDHFKKTYEELVKIPDYNDRLRYLSLKSQVGDRRFGGYRILNQILYSSYKWKEIRRKVILRDCGCDLSHPNFPINGRIFIHHIEPITENDILNKHSCVYDMNNLVSVSRRTHDVIHYGNEESLKKNIFIVRTPNDTCPWRK